MNDDSTPTDPITEPILDRTSLYEQVGDDPELLLTVVELFLEDSREILAALVEGLSRHDNQAVQQGAHRLKGSLLTLGAKPAAAVARELEQMGRTSTLEGANDVFDDLKRQLAALQPELDALTQAT